MARPRKPENAWMPPHVELRDGWYRWKKRGEGAKNLCRADAARSEVWRAYEQHVQDITCVTVGKVIDLYCESVQYRKLKPSTQLDYFHYAKKVREVFGQMDVDTVQSAHVQLFMDARGDKHPTAANHEKSFLSIVYNWGKARGFIKAENPCLPVKNIKVKPGGRVVEEWEYWAFYDFVPNPVKAAMEIAYLCAARRQDVLALTRREIKDDGLLIVQQKTGKAQIKLWTDRLKAAVDLGLQTKTGGKRTSMHIIRNRSGQGYTVSGFTATWKKLQQKALDDGIIKQKFRFHDLKITSVSDYEGDKQQFSGHKTRSMMERYNRRPDKVTPIATTRKSDES